MTERPPAIVRNRPQGRLRSSTHVGTQLAPLMWPVKSVGIKARPAARAASATATRSSRRSADTSSGSGWKSSQSRKTRTQSKPAPAIRAKSSAVSAASRCVHIPMARRTGQ